MPFGLTKAPVTFQAAMNDMFRPVLCKYVLVFMDDILVYSKTWEAHLEHLRAVFHTLLTHGFLAKASKCELAKPRVQYLGHFISGEGMDVDPDKIQAIQQWPKPSTVKQLRGFLGLTGYYRRFILKYAQLAAPLTHLLRKDAFAWDESATAAFEELKIRMATTPHWLCQTLSSCS
ncbi:unnamed protein product [Rhodiola kirilowii]